MFKGCIPVLFFFSTLIVSINCGLYSESNSFESPFNIFTWRSNPLYAEASTNTEFIDRSDNDKREPLAPDYKDPKEVETKPSHAPPPRPFQDVIPGGVIDVNAEDGFGVPDFGSFEIPRVPNLPAIPGLPKIPNFDRNVFSFGNGGNFFGLGGIFSGFGQEFQPWWKGENVCVEREESTDEEDDSTDPDKNSSSTESVPNFFSTSISLSNCQQTPTKYECVTKINNHGISKTFTVRYKCCYGFERDDTNPSSGCSKKVELKTLSQTIDEMEAKEFKTLVSNVNFNMDDGNYTVFLPSDVALAEHEEKMEDMNTVEPSRRRRDVVSTQETILNHFVSGFVDIHDLTNEELLYSQNNNKTIRFNSYPTRGYTRLLTANCVPIKKPNNLAKNGIVHVVDGVLPTADMSITEIISDDEDFSYLQSVLESTNLTEYFKPDGHYTLFAPTNAAFQKLNGDTKEKLLTGKACAATIFKHHIVANTVCTAAIMGNTTTHNINGQIINMERTEDNKLTVENSSIQKRDIIATNGVIQVIDNIVIPDNALYVTEALKKYNMTKFQELIVAAEFEDDNDIFNNATIFAPSNKALEKSEIQEYLTEIKNDKKKLRGFISHHIVKGELEISDMENNMQLETRDGKNVRMNLYSTLPLFANIINRATVNCAPIVDYDQESCGAMIHGIDGVLKSNDDNIYDIISKNANYSTLLEIMEGTGVDEILKDSNQTITFAAPTNEAFDNIREGDMKVLRKDKEKAAMVLKNHILTEILCCSGIGHTTAFGFNSLVSTLSGGSQSVSRSGANYVRIGRAVATSCDSAAINGVVHGINRVLFPQRPSNPHFGLLFFDF